jgi:hypothetical protein
MIAASLTAWDAENRSDTQLMEPLEEIVANLKLGHCNFALIAWDECLYR